MKIMLREILYLTLALYLLSDAMVHHDAVIEYS